MVYGLVTLDRQRWMEKRVLAAATVGLGAILAWSFYQGNSAVLSESSMRILWQLIQGSVAAAILLGYRTPEALSLATGIRTGCGVLCITSILRLLDAAGIEVEKAPGWQWFGKYVTIWQLPPEILKKYPEYFLEDDLAAMNQIFPKGD